MIAYAILILLHRYKDAIVASERANGLLHVIQALSQDLCLLVFVFSLDLSRHCGKKAAGFFTNGEPTATDYQKAPDKGFLLSTGVFCLVDN